MAGPPAWLPCRPVLSLLPWGFETFWWGGIPYYYADNSYYLWDQDAGEYVTVEPPDTSQESADNAGTYAQAGPNGANDVAGGNGPLSTPDLFAYPKKDQPEPQQARDREECRDWAKRQTSYDPSEPHLNSAQEAQNRGSYLRAEAACLEARDYSVKYGPGSPDLARGAEIAHRCAYLDRSIGQWH